MSLLSTVGTLSDMLSDRPPANSGGPADQLGLWTSQSPRSSDVGLKDGGPRSASGWESFPGPRVSNRVSLLFLKATGGRERKTKQVKGGWGKRERRREERQRREREGERQEKRDRGKRQRE